MYALMRDHLPTEVGGRGIWETRVLAYMGLPEHMYIWAFPSTCISELNQNHTRYDTLWIVYPGDYPNEKSTPVFGDRGRGHWCLWETLVERIVMGFPERLNNSTESELHQRC